MYSLAAKCPFVALVYEYVSQFSFLGGQFLVFGKLFFYYYRSNRYETSNTYTKLNSRIHLLMTIFHDSAKKNCIGLFFEFISPFWNKTSHPSNFEVEYLLSISIPSIVSPIDSKIQKQSTKSTAFNRTIDMCPSVFLHQLFIIRSSKSIYIVISLHRIINIIIT